MTGLNVDTDEEGTESRGQQSGNARVGMHAWQRDGAPPFRAVLTHSLCASSAKRLA